MKTKIIKETAFPEVFLNPLFIIQHVDRKTGIVELYGGELPKAKAKGFLFGRIVKKHVMLMLNFRQCL